MLGLQWPQLFSLIVTKCKKLKKMHLEAYTKKKSFFFSFQSLTVAYRLSTLSEIMHLSIL